MPLPSKRSQLDIDVPALRGVTQDSRAVEAGFLFAALRGEAHDGYAYIPDALARGARVILTDKACDLGDDAAKAQCVVSDNPRQDFSYIAAQFYGRQPAHIAAVTGTNGKSSVVHFADQLWTALDESATYIGTLNNALTTPDPVSLFKTLAQMAGDGVSHVAIEASSHGLAQYRLDGAQITVAAFTNFSQDHLDYHTDMDNYFAAKARLFEELLPISGTAVLNADVPEYHEISVVCKKRGIRILSYGKQADDIVLRACTVSGVHQAVSLEIDGRSFDVKIPLVGEFQVMNILCALGCVIAEAPNDERRINKAVNALASIGGVPGRLQHVSDAQGLYHGYVDYAHTPDALKTVLNSLRPHTKGRLICVFGCGGDRDPSKRAMMGEIAAHLSDVVLITDDNPRSENPAIIREQIVGGIEDTAEGIEVVDDRRKAILRGVQSMGKDDILLVAGKGHEQGQIIGDKILPFDDALELSNAFATKSNH